MEKILLAKGLLELNRQSETFTPPACFIGFDGFTDEIVVAVDIRKSNSSFTTINSITSFSERLAKASGKSCNIEFVTQEKKIGGNAPILASGLLNAKHQVIFAGTIGKEEIEPLFKPLTDKCLQVFPLGPSSHSDALEFSDGKIIFGKLDYLQLLTAKQTLESIGEDRFIEALNLSKVFISANWTMLPMMNDLWEAIITKIVPKLEPKERYMFVDFADPAKRTDEDLRKALELLQTFNKTFHVILGLNISEAERLAKLMGIEANGHDKESILLIGTKLIRALQLSQIVIHCSKFACAIDSNNGHSEDTSFTSAPKIKTGAGDNFNAGYCGGLLYGLSLEQSLLLGIATSGFYVRNGKSPNLEELASFLRSWHNQ